MAQPMSNQDFDASADDAVVDEASEQDYDASERGVSADLVRAYLNGIGRTKLLTAAQEVELASKIEAGLFAEECLNRGTYAGEPIDTELAGDLSTVVREGRAAKAHLLE